MRGDRRKCRRLQYKIPFLCRDQKDGTVILEAFSENISAGGMMFKYDGELPTCTEAEFEMYQPAEPESNLVLCIHATGRVVWAMQELASDTDVVSRIGIKFAEMSSEDRARIAWFAAQAQPPEGGDHHVK